VKKIFGIVQVHLDFFETTWRSLHVFGIEFRPQHKVGDDVKAMGVLIKNFCVEADLFLEVKASACRRRNHFARDGFGGASLLP